MTGQSEHVLKSELWEHFMSLKPYRILLTNDDGIDSPGLLAAAETLSALGEVTVVAPRVQQTSKGRSFSRGSDGIIEERNLTLSDGRQLKGYAVGATPAQVVIHALYEILPEKPDLAVSGINFGENAGNCVTISGTMGAAFETASAGIPTLAASLQLPAETANYYDHDQDVDFSPSGQFTALFGRYLLEQGLPDGVDIFKLEVPFSATPKTPWQVTRHSRLRCFDIKIERSGNWQNTAVVRGVPMHLEPGQSKAGTDLNAIRMKGIVSLTPLNIDMTARIDLNALDQSMREGK
jgi:5'/3'-nucleotidase